MFLNVFLNSTNITRISTKGNLRLQNHQAEICVYFLSGNSSYIANNQALANKRLLAQNIYPAVSADYYSMTIGHPPQQEWPIVLTSAALAIMGKPISNYSIIVVPSA